MLQYVNGRLFFDVVPGNLSFCIPDGFWINTEPEELAADYICLYTEDRETVVEVYLQTTDGNGLEQELKDDFEGTPADELDGPYPIHVWTDATGDIPGFAVCFLCDKAEFAALLDIGRHEMAQGGYVDGLMVTVTTKQKGKSREKMLESVRNIVNSAGMRELLGSIRVEQER